MRAAKVEGLLLEEESESQVVELDIRNYGTGLSRKTPRTAKLSEVTSSVSTLARRNDEDVEVVEAEGQLSEERKTLFLAADKQFL